MTCPHCNSGETGRRGRRTSLGYRTVVCRACRSLFNERTGTGFNDLQYPTHRAHGRALATEVQARFPRRRGAATPARIRGHARDHPRLGAPLLQRSSVRPARRGRARPRPPSDLRHLRRNAFAERLRKAHQLLGNGNRHHRRRGPQTCPASRACVYFPVIGGPPSRISHPNLPLGSLGRRTVTATSTNSGTTSEFLAQMAPDLAPLSQFSRNRKRRGRSWEGETPSSRSDEAILCFRSWADGVFVPHKIAPVQRSRLRFRSRRTAFPDSTEFL